jgi:hypothetical protein
MQDLLADLGGRLQACSLSCQHRTQPDCNTEGVRSMMDILMIGIGVLFFALSLAYVQACDRL